MKQSSATQDKKNPIGGVAMVGAIDVANAAQEEIAEVTRLELAGVRGLSREDGKWHVTVELVEKKSIPDAQDLLGGYEVTVDQHGKVLGFERKTLRRRGDTEIKEV